jgi:hypothetical protein
MLGGGLVGEAEGGVVGGWEIVGEASVSGRAFGMGGEAGMVILDEQGRVAFLEVGLIPFWKLSLAADVVGIEPKEFKGRKKKD